MAKRVSSPNALYTGSGSILLTVVPIRSIFKASAGLIRPHTYAGSMNAERPTPEEVWRMLEAVTDPELHASIVDLGMVRDVDVDDEGIVGVEIALTIAGCPLRAQIRDDVEARLRHRPGVTGVEVRMGEMGASERTEVMQRARRKAQE